MQNKLPGFISRISLSLALVGALVGVVISFNNGDEIGWSLLRGTVLFLVFGLVSRWWLAGMAKMWLESRLEALQAKTKTADAPSPRPGRSTN